MEVIKPLLSIPFYLKVVSYKKLTINVIRDILRYEHWINNVLKSYWHMLTSVLPSDDLDRSIFSEADESENKC